MVQPQLNLMYDFFLCGIVLCHYIDSKIILQENFVKTENFKISSQKMETPL